MITEIENHSRVRNSEIWKERGKGTTIGRGRSLLLDVSVLNIKISH